MKVETEFTHIWVLAFLIIRSHTSFRLVVEGQRGIALKAVTRHMQQSNSSNIHALWWRYVCLLFHFKLSNSVLCPTGWCVLCTGRSFISVLICVSFVPTGRWASVCSETMIRSMRGCEMLSLRYLMCKGHDRLSESHHMAPQLVLFMSVCQTVMFNPSKMTGWEMCFWPAKTVPGPLAVQHRRQT